VTGRAALKFLRLVAAIGLAMSFVGLVILLVISVTDLATRPMPPAAPQRLQIYSLGVLQPFHEAGIPLLLAALVYAVCEIGLHLLRPRTSDHDPD
jgi:hypothetical protein